jgi:murein DD-endopeptidase MepM/ murein hydrolase activator NlpD
MCAVLLLSYISSFGFTLNYPDEVVQGGIYVIGAADEGNIASIRGEFMGRNIFFNPTRHPDAFAGIMGVNLIAEPGIHRLKITVLRTDGNEDTLYFTVTVKRGNFKAQYLTVPDKWVHYDEKTLERIRKENKIVGAVYKTETETRLWSAPFMMPLEGRITAEFGLRRFFNGEPRASHSGIDISAVTGTPVLAANDGKVALAMDLFFSGLSLFIDHGQGLYTMYFHLSDILVSEGDSVKKGEVIALVGATGRVTGAHLHFGVRLNNNKVNPWDLVNVEIP